MSPNTLQKPKHRQIYDQLREGILAGDYLPGQRLPSEAELVGQFTTSRPTAARALRDLQHAGLVERRVGSGTYVAERAQQERGSLFGLLIPGLGEAEVFEPICGQIARSAQQSQCSLLWGDSLAEGTDPLVRRMKQICQQYIEKQTAGVFFAPLELEENQDEINQRIVIELDQAGIAIVLLDRDIVSYPNRSRYDLVGIDNRRAGAVMAEHLLGLGCQRIDFVARPLSAPTVALRIAGYRDALSAAGITPEEAWVHYGEPDDVDFVDHVVNILGASAVICANDVTAGHFMQSLSPLNRRVPDDVRVVGFDDVKYAKLLRKPLTTLRQPCHDIGREAMTAMRERITRPNMPARDILVAATLVVRKSCGAS